MAETARPIIQKITPFDAAKDYEIALTWLGSRAHANRIVICDNNTNSVVFDDTVSSFSLKHLIPAHTLSNNRKYTIEAQVYDVENIPSALSAKVLFYTFATPDFYFEDATEDFLITSSSYPAAVHYYSEDWEELGKYMFYLYDSSRKLLIQSTEMTDDHEISYTYKGLDNNTTYYVRCTGVTVNGMELDTGYTKIHVKYENPNTYARIYATPLPSQGCIQVATNLIIIQYNGTDSFDYIDGMIDLRDKTLYYDSGFLIKDDFTVIIRGINLWQTADLFKMNNGILGLTLSSRIYNDGRLRFRLMVPNGIGHYLLYSAPQVFGNEDMVTIAIRRKGNVYQLKVFVELGFTTDRGDMWYGYERPAQHLIQKYDNWINTDEETHKVSRDAFTEYLGGTEPAEAVQNDLWFGGD